MRIAIINTLPVPSGNASVNRFLGYGKELVRMGVEVDVLTSARCESCEIEGVNIISCGNGTSLFGALRKITKRVRKGGYDAAILISNSLLLIYPLWLACKRGKVKFLQEKSEFPFVLMKKGFLHGLYAKMYVNTTYRLFDGLIVMTKPLMEYFKDKVRKDCKLLEMPMTVDTERFAIERTESEYGDYIAYCGNMAGKKDGVLNLIEAFNLASSKIGDVKLLLIGGSSNQDDWNRIVDYVKQTGNQRIVMFGKATREQMPSLLKNAKALALARPSSLQSEGGFPTKLGEYLATGNPVIVTAVGDIPQYLNETNAFVVEPDNNEAFAATLEKMFANYEQAVAIGKGGQELAQTIFSSKEQSKRLFNYLESVCEQRCWEIWPFSGRIR